MKINTHLSIMLLPLFVFVALTSGFLRYYFEERELFWGAEEEGRGLVIAISAFIEAYSFEDLNTGKLQKEFTKVFKWGKAENIILHSKNQSQSFEVTDDGSGLQQSLIKPGHDILQGQFVNFDYTNLDKIFSWKIIKLKNTSDNYILGIQSDISHIAPLLSDVRKKIITQTSFVGLFSLLFSFLVSSLVSGKVRQLSSVLKNRQSGKPAENVNDGLIGELNDLNNTFKTMDSLLQESTENIKSSSVNFSKNCSETELAEKYNKTFLPETVVENALNVKNSKLLVRLTNIYSDSDLFEINKSENKIEIIMGTFREKNCPELWKFRSAAQTYLKYLLNSKLSFGEIESACFKVFPELNLKGITIDADISGGDKQFRITEYRNGEPLAGRKQDIFREAYFAHNMGSENAQIAEEYLRNVKDSSIRALSAEISPILRHQQNGVVLLLGAGG